MCEETLHIDILLTFKNGDGKIYVKNSSASSD